MDISLLTSVSSSVLACAMLYLRPKKPIRVARLTVEMPTRHVDTAQQKRSSPLQRLDEVLSRIGRTFRILCSRTIWRIVPQVRERLRRPGGEASNRTSLIPDRTLGLLVQLCVVFAVIQPMFIMVSVVLVGVVQLFAPRVHARRAAGRKRDAVERALPLLLDLLRSGVASGISTRAILSSLQVGTRIDDLSTFDDALGSLRGSLRSGVGFVDALRVLNDEGPAVVGLVAALAATEHYGVSIAPTLDALTSDARLVHRRRIEMNARRLPVLLLFPLVVFILPAFLVLTVAPLLFSGLSSIQW